MTKRIFKSGFILLFIITIFPLISFAEGKEKIILTTHNLAPYGSFDEEKKFDGHAVRVVKYALDKMEKLYEIKVTSWKKAQYMVKEEGSADGFFAGSQNSERDDYAVMSEIIAEQKWNWYQLKSNPYKSDDLQFKHKAGIGAFVGSNMLKWLKKNDYHVTSEPYTTEELTDLLILKRIDAFLANNLVMDEIIKKRHLEDKFRITLLKNKPLGVYFSKKFIKNNPNFLNEFNKFVKEIRSKNY